MNTYIQFCGDVSGSMASPFSQTYDINQNFPRAESLFGIMEKTVSILSKKNKNVLFSSMLFGCQKSPVTDFLLLIDFIILNIPFFKQLQIDEEIDYKYLLTELLLDAGAKNIRKYMYRDESPNDKECTLFYKILKDKPYMVQEIIKDLPSAAKKKSISKLVDIGKSMPFFGGNIQNKESDAIIEEIRNIKKKLEVRFESEIRELNKVKDFNWEIDMPVEKASDEILKSLKIIHREFQKNNKGNKGIFDYFKRYIYYNTPLCYCLTKSFEFMKKKEKDSNKILIYLSDGESTDGDILDIYNKYKDIDNLFIVGAYMSTEKIQNEKTLFDEFNTEERGAKQLFQISTEIETDSVAFDYLRDKGWTIPSSGKCRLFIQINNIDNLNDFIEFINKLLDGTEDVLGDILGLINLKELTGKNINKFEVTNQIIGNCYLHATRNIIRMARARIFPPNIPNPDEIEKEIIKEFPYQYDKEGNVLGRNTFEVLQRMVPKYRLNVNQILGNSDKEMERKVKSILLRRRPVVLTFRLTEKQWDNFCNFFDKSSPNKKGFITKEEINKNVPNNDKDGGGHSVVITKYTKDYFTILNSWGDEWGDNGLFKIKDFSVFLSYRYFDVFYTLKDLTQYEKDEYQKMIERKKIEFLEEDP